MKFDRWSAIRLERVCYVNSKKRLTLFNSYWLSVKNIYQLIYIYMYECGQCPRDVWRVKNVYSIHHRQLFCIIIEVKMIVNVHFVSVYHTDFAPRVSELLEYMSTHILYVIMTNVHIIYRCRLKRTSKNSKFGLCRAYRLLSFLDVVKAPLLLYRKYIERSITSFSSEYLSRFTYIYTRLYTYSTQCSRKSIAATISS